MFEHRQSIDSTSATIKTSSCVFNHIDQLYKKRLKRNLKAYNKNIVTESVEYANRNNKRAEEIIARIKNSDGIKVTRIG